MLNVLANRTYRHLFLAQVIALVGTGLATVALGLLAYNLAGANAGEVLGTALAIKMIAYVGVSPIAAAFAERLPRKTMLIGLDLVRAGVALALPFVSQVWQVYILVFVLQSASAGFTPTFQATIPDVLPDEKDYNHALSLSRLAYDLENVASPMLAAVLLTVIDFHNLFAGTVMGFLASAVLVQSVTLPTPTPAAPRGIYDRITRGTRIYFATPRLRGLLAISFAVACAGAMVIVNTVVLVQARFGLTARETAMALGAFGGGSMIAALAMPRLLEQLSDRTFMITGAGIAGFGLLLGVIAPSYYSLFALWVLIGFGYALAQTPSGKLLRRSAHAEDRPSLFAAQFALSHTCWLATYPLAGWLGSRVGLPATFGILALMALSAAFAASRLWSRLDPAEIEHTHTTLKPSDEHLRGAAKEGKGFRHAHTFIIDSAHPEWPNQCPAQATR
ncbi:MAG: MFS transporter [Hyphomicrobiales bacterium]|nr:MAG: MFS transporter [Hyphomicrobiales bacterium]